MTVKILFVCSGNTDRSPTAEVLLKFDKRFEAKSAGICEYAPVKLTRELIDWADVILAMEDLHKKVILRIVPKARRKIIVLNIRERFPYGSPKLVRLLIRRLKSNGITVPYVAWDEFIRREMSQSVFEKRCNIKGSCGCGGKIVLAYDGERVCQKCGKVSGSNYIRKYLDWPHLPCTHWSGSQDNQEKQLETDVERRGWG